MEWMNRIKARQETMEITLSDLRLLLQLQLVIEDIEPTAFYTFP